MSKDSPTFDNQTSLCFLNIAESFYDSARLFRATEGNPELLNYIPGHKGYARSPILANAARAIELALKGYLRATGKSCAEIRHLGGRNGHDLMRLYRECVSTGMQSLFSTEDEEKDFREVSKRHVGKDFEFPDVQLHRGAPSLDSVLKLVGKVIEAVSSMCKSNAMKHHDQPTVAKAFNAKKMEERGQVK